MTPLPSDTPTAPADRDQQARDLVRALHLLGVTIWLDGAGLNARPMSLLSQELRDEIEELKPELVELLKTEGTEDLLTLDAEEKQHSDRNTPSRFAAEVQADAEKAQAAAKQRRQYQNGQVIVHNHDGLTGDRGRNSFGRHMELLVREKNHRAAIEDGTLPPQGRYVHKWNLFG